ncbi:Flp pilus assembly protein TadD, partial [Striga asiatica]
GRLELLLRKGYCESKHQEVFKFGWDRTLSVGQVILDTKPTDNGEPFEFENELRAELPQGPLMVSIRTTQRLINLTSDKICTMASGGEAEYEDEAEAERVYFESKHQEVFKFSWEGLQVVKQLVGEVVLDTKPTDNGEPFEFENELRAKLSQGLLMVSIRTTQRLANLTSNKICTIALVSPDRGGGGGRQGVSLKNALDAMRRYRGEEDRNTTFIDWLGEVGVVFEKKGVLRVKTLRSSSLAGTGLQVVKHLVGEVILDTKPSDNGESFKFEN